jgi:hypothetical protein
VVCTDDVNLLGDNIDSIKKNTETRIDYSKEDCLDVNAEKAISTRCCAVIRMKGKIMT